MNKIQACFPEGRIWPQRRSLPMSALTQQVRQVNTHDQRLSSHNCVPPGWLWASPENFFSEKPPVLSVQIRSRPDEAHTVVSE